MKNARRFVMWVAAVLFCTFVAADAAAPNNSSAKASAAQKGPKYVIVAWNNLGMHCYDNDYSVFGVLPPYNTLFAQVIQVADPPVIVTEGVTISYSFPSNTYSAGKPGAPDKTNFWQYAQQMFHLSQPLAVNVGLTGNGLSGTMTPVGDHFEVTGIPLTEYRDQDAVKRSPYPFQMAQLKATKTDGGGARAKKVASLSVVAPISSELSCFMCHADDGDATTRYPITPTGDVKKNILAIHDYLNPGAYDPPLAGRQPFLCADCHGTNALGMAGQPGVSSLSRAMHNHHNKDLVPDIAPDTTDGCYSCHPGPNTKCLRDAMSQQFSLNCTNCHGNMADVAAKTDPWLNEPKCETCHGSAYQCDQPLYRDSHGHGGVYCAGCHDSPHAYAISREHNDATKFIQLQGHKGALRDCTVCHLTAPTSRFHHIQ